MPSDLDGDSAVAEAAKPVHVDSPEAFAAILDREGLFLVDFHALWCGPCLMMDPVLTGIAASTSATVVKVDVDENPDLAAEHGVRSVPTFLVVVDGEVQERLVGAQSEMDFKALIDRYGP